MGIDMKLKMLSHEMRLNDELGGGGEMRSLKTVFGEEMRCKYKVLKIQSNETRRQQKKVNQNWIRTR